MKKNTYKKKLWFKIVIIKRQKRNRISRLKKRTSNCVKCNGKFSKKMNFKYIKIQAPLKLGFDNFKTREIFINWIKKLRSITIKNGKKVIIDFTNSKNAEPLGFLLLMANIENIINIKGKKTLRGIKPIDDVTQQLFKQINLAKWLNIKIEKSITSKNVKFWHYIDGTEIEASEAGKLIVKIAEKSNINNELVEDLYNGVTEAMTNTIMHAYDDKIYKCKINENNKWYMFTTTMNDQLTVVMCDIGIGIPGSLKIKHENFFHKFISLFATGKEGQLIQRAISEQLSKSEKPHRGYGMAEMKKFINTAGAGTVSIMSSKGIYQYFGERDEEKCFDLEIPIQGTMVGWTVPIEKFNSLESKT